MTLPAFKGANIDRARGGARRSHSSRARESARLRSDFGTWPECDTSVDAKLHPLGDNPKKQHAAQRVLVPLDRPWWCQTEIQVDSDGLHSLVAKPCSTANNIDSSLPMPSRVKTIGKCRYGPMYCGGRLPVPAMHEQSDRPQARLPPVPIIWKLSTP